MVCFRFQLSRYHHLCTESLFISGQLLVPINQTHLQNRDCLRPSRSSHKLLIIVDSAMVLSKMARSPNLRPIFLDFEFKPIYLPGEHGIAPPTDISFWVHRIQAMWIEGSVPEASIQVSTPEVGEENCGSEDSNNPHQILEQCIQEAVESNSNCQIHAEVKVLGYFQGYNLFGKAINSVGINKLCYPACLEYVRILSAPQSRCEAPIISGTHGT